MLKLTNLGGMGMAAAGNVAAKGSKTRAYMPIPRMWQGTYRVGAPKRHILLKSILLSAICIRFCLHVG